MGFSLANMLMRQSETLPPPAVVGSESIMKNSARKNLVVQQDLRWECDQGTADRICNHNRRYAERSGYFTTRSDFLNEVNSIPEGSKLTFYDSNTGKPLFMVPHNRTMKEFLDESRKHGWPSFRDDEVDWDNVRVLKNGEAVSIDGTHLGHNLPDKKGRRYCINLVCIAGRQLDNI